MRVISIFVGGILAGMGIQIAIGQSQNSGIVGVNHVGIAFEDIDAAIEHYTGTLGFPEAFRIENDAGEVVLMYVQVSESTFVELQGTNENRGPGISHVGVVVDDMEAALSMWRERGIELADGNRSGTGAILSNIFDPWGNRIELLELPPDSEHAQATARWGE